MRTHSLFFSGRTGKVRLGRALDYLNQIVSGIVAQRPLSDASFAAKSLLLGSNGAGERTIAEKLAIKWNIVPIDLNKLIKRRTIKTIWQILVYFILQQIFL